MTFNNGNNTYLPISPMLPMSLLITAITNSSPAIITVATANSYIPGMLVNLVIPSDYGMYQANGLTVQLLGVNGLNFTCLLDTTNFDPFTTPPAGVLYERPASLSPGGSRNSYNITNIPFRSEGNFGN